MRNRFPSLAPPALAALLLAALLLAAGCERGPAPPATAEVDEPAYRRGKELLRQGRNQEALAEFNQVLEKRGLNHAPEAHLEIGLLCQQHINDPIAAIYHFRKYRELRPDSPQSDLVRQRLEASMREYARTLPGRQFDAGPLAPADHAAALQRLQRENEQLQAALTAARSAARLSATGGRSTIVQPAPPAPAGRSAIVQPAPAPDEIYPLATPAPAPAPNAGAPPARPPGPATTTYARFQQQQQQQQQQPPPQQPQPAPPPQPRSAMRIHTVRTGDTLYNIARQYYDTASTARVNAIYEANRDVLRSTTDLRPGMQLRIP